MSSKVAKNKRTELATEVRNDFLKKKMEARGMNPHSVAVELAKIREQKTGKKYTASMLRNTVDGCVKNPANSKFETVREIVQALDGDIAIRWREVEVISKETFIEEDLSDSSNENA